MKALSRTEITPCYVCFSVGVLDCGKTETVHENSVSVPMDDGEVVGGLEAGADVGGDVEGSGEIEGFWVALFDAQEVGQGGAIHEFHG